MTDFAPDGIAAVRTSAYNEYFNTDGSKATPLFDGSFGRCFWSQAARQWSGVCISVTLWLVYRHLLRRPRRSSANTVARHTLPSIALVCESSLLPLFRKPLDTYRLIITRNSPDDRRGKKDIRPKKRTRQRKRRKMNRVDRSVAISECDESSLTSTQICVGSNFAL